MISGWKLRRELRHLGQQLRGFIDRLTDPAAQRCLDHAVAAGLPQTGGMLPVRQKVALYLVYQPAGLAASTLETCRMLSHAGYAPLVISNNPLTAEDRERLKPVVWRAIERPNFGYDFGGYRDGLTCLRQWGIAPDELVILNDSVWLPVFPGTDLMDRLAAETAEIAGTTLTRRGTERFLESYLLRLRRPALEHPAFLEFWSTLQLTSNKYHVIRRGERGFSAKMLAAGLQIAAVYDNAELPDLISKQDEGFLRLTLRHAAYTDAALATESEQLQARGGPAWRNATMAHIRRVLMKRHGYASFPYANMHLTGYPLLKKSTDPGSKAWRLAYLGAIETEDLPAPSATMLTEIRARDAGR